jgi:hypothetical protein
MESLGVPWYDLLGPLFVIGLMGAHWRPVVGGGSVTIMVVPQAVNGGVRACLAWNFIVLVIK